MLGYNQIERVERTQGHELIDAEYQGNLFLENVSPSWSATSSSLKPIGNILSGAITSFDIYNPTFTITTNKANGFTTGGSEGAVSSGYVRLQNFNGSSTITYTNEKFMENFKNTTDIGSWNYSSFYFYGSSGGEAYITFDFGSESIPTFNYHLATSACYSYLEYSEDNTTWTQYTQINTASSTKTGTITPSQSHRYWRIRASKNSSSSANGQFHVYYFYVSNIKFKTWGVSNDLYIDTISPLKNKEMIYVSTPENLNMQNVVENRFNEKTIDVLLKPNKKYKLVYNEDTNKFEIKPFEKEPLFEITLTEAVNQVDLTGIANMLKTDKLYCVIIDGTCSASTNIDLGMSTITKGDTFTIYSPITFSTRYSGSSLILLGTAVGIGDTWFSNSISGYEYIKCTTSTATFNAGTRIIIKEVA